MLLDIAYNTLNETQKQVFEEAKYRNKCGLSLPLGFGKTITSLAIGLYKIQHNNKKVLIVCSKTLLSNWENEIKKFFGDKLKYIVLHPDKIADFDNFQLTNNIKMVITTPNVTSKYYKFNNLEEYIIYTTQRPVVGNLLININNYRTPPSPLIDNALGGDILYSTDWGCLIVDEVHNYTNINATNCRSIVALSAKHRYALSGTIFSEPKVEKILGYYCIINDDTFPKTIPDASASIKYRNYGGYEKSMIVRNNIVTFVKPKINEFIISHELTHEETKLYLAMKKLLLIINTEVKRFKKENDIHNARLYRGYLLIMIIYIRQSIVSPILPIANAMLNHVDNVKKSILSSKMLNLINSLDLLEWLNDSNNLVSSRINEVLKIVNKHQGEKLIIFTEYLSVVKLIRFLIPKKFNQLTISADMNLEDRKEVLQRFDDEPDNILVLTYKIGSTGLNLQTCRNMILVDLCWNAGHHTQAVARILRPGTLHRELNIYYLISNTGIENALLEKNKTKLELSEELKSSGSTKKIKTMNLEEVLKIIEKDTNISTLKFNHTFK